MQRLRARRGLAPGAYETIILRRGPGPLKASTGTRIELAGNPIRLIVDEIERLRWVLEGQMVEVKAFVIPSFPLAVEMAAAISGAAVAPSGQW